MMPEASPRDGCKRDAMILWNGLPRFPPTCMPINDLVRRSPCDRVPDSLSLRPAELDLPCARTYRLPPLQTSAGNSEGGLVPHPITTLAYGAVLFRPRQIFPLPLDAKAALFEARQPAGSWNRLCAWAVGRALHAARPYATLDLAPASFARIMRDVLHRYD